METESGNKDEGLYMFLVMNGYFHFNTLPTRGLCALAKYIFTTAIVYGLNRDGYKGRYCYETLAEATDAFDNWDGVGDPPGNWIVNKGDACGDRYNPDRK